MGLSSGLEMFCQEDSAWYDGKLRRESDKIIVHFNGFDSAEDEEFDIKLLRDPVELKGRVRRQSLQLQDNQCKIVNSGQLVCACFVDVDDRKYYDAKVFEKIPNTHRISGDGEQECLCEFKVSWISGPKKGETTSVGIGEVCLLSPETPENHKMIKMLLEGMDKMEERRDVKGKKSSSNLSRGSKKASMKKQKPKESVILEQVHTAQKKTVQEEDKPTDFGNKNDVFKEQVSGEIGIAKQRPQRGGEPAECVARNGMLDEQAPEPGDKTEKRPLQADGPTKSVTKTNSSGSALRVPVQIANRKEISREVESSELVTKKKAPEERPSPRGVLIRRRPHEVCKRGISQHKSGKSPPLEDERKASLAKANVVEKQVSGCSTMKKRPREEAELREGIFKNGTVPKQGIRGKRALRDAESEEQVSGLNSMEKSPSRRDLVTKGYDLAKLVSEQVITENSPTRETKTMKFVKTVEQASRQGSRKDGSPQEEPVTTDHASAGHVLNQGLTKKDSEQGDDTLGERVQVPGTRQKTPPQEKEPPECVRYRVPAKQVSMKRMPAREDPTEFVSMDDVLVKQVLNHCTRNTNVITSVITDVPEEPVPRQGMTRKKRQEIREEKPENSDSTSWPCGVPRRVKKRRELLMKDDEDDELLEARSTDHEGSVIKDVVEQIMQDDTLVSHSGSDREAQHRRTSSNEDAVMDNYYVQNMGQGPGTPKKKVAWEEGNGVLKPKTHWWKKRSQSIDRHNAPQLMSQSSALVTGNIRYKSPSPDSLSVPKLVVPAVAETNVRSPGDQEMSCKGGTVCDNGSRTLLIENMKRNVSALDAMEILVKITDGISAVHVMPAREFDSSTIGYALYKDTKSAEVALMELNSCNRFIASHDGRPWVGSMAQGVQESRLLGFAMHYAFKRDEPGCCGIVSDQASIQALQVITLENKDMYDRASRMRKLYDEHRNLREKLYARIVEEEAKEEAT